eukprot:scaffold6058_cov159-Isochrysis_galbana.AAC.2
MASLIGDVIGMKNVLGYSAASQELVTGAGGASLLASTQALSESLALKADKTALIGLATTQALTEGLAAKADATQRGVIRRTVVCYIHCGFD